MSFLGGILKQSILGREICRHQQKKSFPKKEIEASQRAA
jgi:hypothetical protein